MSWGNDETTIFIVLVNDEEQYSLWPKDKSVPGGWRSTGKEGVKHECLRYVAVTWTDMRPLSVRRAMAAPNSSANDPPAASASLEGVSYPSLGSVRSDVIH